MSYKLSGINPLAYVGVEPSTPPQMIVEPRSPTPNDSRGYNLGTYWLVAAPPPTMNWELWILVDLTAGVATWVQLFPGGTGGVIRLDADVGFAIPTLGVINVLGGPNINTFGDMANNLFINLNDAIRLPNTNNTGNAGIIYLGATGGAGGQTFLHNYGTDNTFLGSLAGNLTLNVLSATQNVGIGHLSLNALVTAGLNTAVGDEALSSLQSGAANVALGSGALVALVSGSDDICLGTNAGVNYTTNESSNIIIGNDGVLGESNTIRIGEDGVGAGQQNSAFMAGIYNRTVGATFQSVIVDNTGKLGSQPSAPVTPNAFSFMGIQTANATNVTGDGTTYGLGSNVAYTILFDNSSGSFFPGDGLGTPASFTAPITGVYCFSVKLLAQRGGGTLLLLHPTIEVQTPTRSYFNWGAFTGGPAGNDSLVTNTTTNSFGPMIPFITIADLTAGDVVLFNVTSGSGVELKNVSLSGYADARSWIYGYILN